MAKTIKDLDSKVNDLKLHFNEELLKFRDEISKVKSPSCDVATNVEPILDRFDLFKASIENRLVSFESEILLLKKEAELSLRRADNAVQHSNRNKVFLFGLPEKPGEDLVTETVKIFNNKLYSDIVAGDIYNSYRAGKKNDNKPRPVIVEFCHVWKRNKVFYGKKHLKGTGLVIAEVLSPLRSNVFKLAKKKFGRGCWSSGGRVGFKVGNTVKYVISVEQFNAASRSVANDGHSADSCNDPN